MKPQHEKLNYMEYPSKDLVATKLFFESVFSWSFIDYGDEYTAFDHQGLEGGFFKSELSSRTENGAALSIFFSNDIDATYTKIVRYGGTIIQEIFSFPGGRRFHFLEPGGSEFAVWALPPEESETGETR